MGGSDLVGDNKLGVVGVLVLVDHDILVPVLKTLPNLGIVVEELGGLQKQVVKINCIISSENLIVTAVQFCYRFRIEVICLGLEGFRINELVLGSADGSQNSIWSPIGITQITRSDRFFHRTLLVAGIVNCKGSCSDDSVSPVPKDSGTKRMERGDSQAPHIF